MTGRGLNRRTFLLATGAGLAVTALEASPFGPAPQARAVPALTATELEARLAALDNPVYIFESAVPATISTTRGTASISAERFASGTHSLKWEPRGGTLRVATPLNYAQRSYVPGQDQNLLDPVDTFTVHLYSERPSAEPLTVTAMVGERESTSFRISLDFTGWRTCWVRWGYDLDVAPSEDVDSVVLSAPAGVESMHLDLLMLNTPGRAEIPEADHQVPFVMKDRALSDQRTWISLLYWEQTLAAAPIPAPELEPADSADLAEVEERYRTWLRLPQTVTQATVDAVLAAVDAAGVPAPGTRGRSRPIYSIQQRIFPPEHAADLNAYVNAVTLRVVTDLMQRVARTYTEATQDDHRSTLAGAYLRLVDYARDYGWAAGSAQGSTFGLGYNIRGFYDSVYLMQDVLRANGLFDAVRADLAWYAGIGRCSPALADAVDHAGIADVFLCNTRALVAVAMLQDTPQQRAGHLRAVRDWIGTAFDHSPGINDGLKPDATFFHHCGFYPSYTRDGLSGLAPMVAVLARTRFAVAPDAHERIRRVTLLSRAHSNLTSTPLTMSGRTVTGTVAISPYPFEQLTRAGTPDGSRDLDPETGAAFLRLLPARPNSAQRALKAELEARGITAEPAPEGNWTLGYAAASLHRRDDWLLTVRGHNRYLWSHETYENANLYGRFLTYGHIQVQHRGAPIDHAHSGYSQDGWNWSRLPGTTAPHLPLDELRTVLRPGGWQEMLLTESRFGGSGTLGDNGVFGLRLQSSPKYDGSLRALKSVFMFDDRIVALGTGVTHGDSRHDTGTTLFQTSRLHADVPVRGGWEPGRTVRLTSDRWLVDPVGIGYWIRRGQRLRMAEGVQESANSGTGAPNAGPFSVAVLDHGRAPEGASYEYAMVVGADAARMEAWSTAMATPGAAPYRVLRQDTIAHVVADTATRTTGYVAFAETHLDVRTVVRHISSPSLVMVQEHDAGLRVSVTDPDLRLYDGRDPDLYDAAGTYLPDLSPYQRSWRHDPSQPLDVRVTFQGDHDLVRPTDGVRVERRGAGQTVLVVTCFDGRPVEVELT